MHAALAALFATPGGESIELPVTRLSEVSLFDVLLSYPPIKSLLPIPILLAIAPVIIWFFRSTWRKLDAEAAEYRASLARDTLQLGSTPRQDSTRRTRRKWRVGAAGNAHGASAPAPIRRLRRRRPVDSPEGQPNRVTPWNTAWTAYQRPAVCLLLVAVILTIQEYYGGRQFYTSSIQPLLRELEADGHTWIGLKHWDELYSYGWWVSARVIGYVLVPFPVWKLLFPNDSLLDMGLRVRGLLRHAWIYALCLAVVLPLVWLVSQQPDFGNYYPFYKNSSRSWLDFALWQAIYWVQFLALEMFFRGWIVGALRKTMGSGAIFAMALPYCMIHYGKPYLEAHGAIVAGVVLGSLAMRTRSIYSGFLVHITVAFLMDFVALWKGRGLPTEWLPPL